MSNYAISENSRYHMILMKHLVPAEAGTLFRRSYIFQLGALFCIAMPNNAYKYLLLSHFLFAKWPLRGWPDFGSIFICHSSYRCTCFPLDQVQKHILYIVAYSIFGGRGARCVTNKDTIPYSRLEVPNGVYMRVGICMGVDSCAPNLEEKHKSVFTKCILCITSTDFN